MDSFKDFLIESDFKMKNLSDSIITVINQLCDKNSLARPKQLIDIGNSLGHVYKTSQDFVVIRAAPRYNSDCEYMMISDKLQDTGGVAKIYHIEDANVLDVMYTFSWKELIDTNVSKFLDNTKPKLFLLKRLLSGLYAASDEEVKELANYKQTVGLYQAIESGLPRNDLDIRFNLGVTKDGRIVAYDC